MKITNISAGPRGVNGVSGPVLIEPGQAVEVAMTEAEAKVSKGTGWFEFVEDKAPERPPVPAYEAKHRGAGSYSVLDAEGKEVLEKLTKEDAEAFNALSAEERAAYVAKA